MHTIADLIAAQAAQLAATKAQEAANAAKQAADQRLAEISLHYARITNFGIFYEVSPEYFMQKVSETSVQLIPRQTLPLQQIQEE